MKKVTCKEMGGPCEAEITGETAEDTATAGYEHIKGTADEAHKGMKKKIDDSSKEEKAKWMKGFEETFANAPDA